MTEQDKLMLDDANRIAQLEAVKNEVRGEVRAEVMRHANQLDPVEQEQAAEIGAQIKQTAIIEVARTEREIQRARAAARVTQIVNYVFFTVYWLIGLEIVLELFGAREGNGFRQFIHAVTAPVLAPFRQLFYDPSVGPFQLRFSYVAALIVYALLHWFIKRTIRLTAKAVPVA